MAETEKWFSEEASAQFEHLSIVHEPKTRERERTWSLVKFHGFDHANYDQFSKLSFPVFSRLYPRWIIFFLFCFLFPCLFACILTSVSPGGEISAWKNCPGKRGRSSKTAIYISQIRTLIEAWNTSSSWYHYLRGNLANFRVSLPKEALA